VEFYNRGGLLNSMDPSIRPLRLSPSDIDALVAFLEGLTSVGAQPSASE